MSHCNTAVHDRLEGFVRRQRRRGNLSKEQFDVWSNNPELQERACAGCCGVLGVPNDDTYGVDWEAVADFWERMIRLFFEYSDELLAFIIALIDAFSAKLAAG